MSEPRCASHEQSAVRTAHPTGLRYGIVTLCVGGGMGAAGLFEAYRG